MAGVLTANKEARVDKMLFVMADWSPSELRRAIASMLVRIEAIEDRIGSKPMSHRADPRLIGAAWHRDKDVPETIIGALPGTGGHTVTFSLKKPIKTKACSICADPVEGGTKCYLPEWDKDTWVREHRICNDCGLSLAPVRGDDGEDEQGQGEARGEGACAGTEDDPEFE